MPVSIIHAEAGDLGYVAVKHVHVYSCTVNSMIHEPALCKIIKLLTNRRSHILRLRAAARGIDVVTPPANYSYFVVFPNRKTMRSGIAVGSHHPGHYGGRRSHMESPKKRSSTVDERKKITKTVDTKYKISIA